MPTYNVRADGTQGTALSATGDISDAGNAMTIATFATAINADAFSSDDIILISGRGGLYTNGSVAIIGVDSITISGESGHEPTINYSDTGGIKTLNCSNSLVENLTILNAGTSGVEWTGTGTGHVIRNVVCNVAANNCFSNELTTAGATVHAYGVTARNSWGGADGDGWSSHGGSAGGSISYLYGCVFEGNFQNMGIVGDAKVYLYNSVIGLEKTSQANATGLFLGATTASGINFYAYDCTIAGSVTGTTTDTDIIEMAHFERCHFLCKTVSQVANMNFGSVNFGTANAVRKFTVKFYSCVFEKPVSGKVQAFFRSGSGSGSSGYSENCLYVHDSGSAENAAWDLMNATDSNEFKNCNFINANVGINGANAAMSISYCNFDNCGTNYVGTPGSVSNVTTSASGLEGVTNGDYRLAVGSDLIDAGTTLTTANTLDINGTPYQTDDIGPYTYSATDIRPIFSGIRPPV